MYAHSHSIHASPIDLFQDLDLVRHSLKSSSDEEVIVYADPARADPDQFRDAVTGQTMEMWREPIGLLDWLIDHQHDYQTRLEFVSNRTFKDISADAGETLLTCFR